MKELHPCPLCGERKKLYHCDEYISCGRCGTAVFNLPEPQGAAFKQKSSTPYYIRIWNRQLLEKKR